MNGFEEMVESVVSKVDGAAITEERGEGKGVGGPKQGDGGTETCVCPECGSEYAHEKGTPCNAKVCKQCNVKLVGKKNESAELDESPAEYTHDMLSNFVEQVMEIIDKEVDDRGNQPPEDAEDMARATIWALMKANKDSELLQMFTLWRTASGEI